jgi:hypothetical protein
MKKYVDINNYNDVKNNCDLSILYLRDKKMDVPHHLISIKIIKTEKEYSHLRKNNIFKRIILVLKNLILKYLD